MSAQTTVTCDSCGTEADSADVWTAGSNWSVLMLATTGAQVGHVCPSCVAALLGDRAPAKSGHELAREDGIPDPTTPVDEG